MTHKKIEAQIGGRRRGFWRGPFSSRTPKRGALKLRAVLTGTLLDAGPLTKNNKVQGVEIQTVWRPFLRQGAKN